MNSYIHKLYVHHNYVKRHFEIDFSHGDEEGFHHLILTGKNGAGKSTLLKSINKELFLYKTGIPPLNNYFVLQSEMEKKELEHTLDGLEFVNPKVEIQFGKESDFLEEDLLVIFIPTQRLTIFEGGDKKSKLDLGEVIQAQNIITEQLKSSNLDIANIKQNITTLEDFIEESKTISNKILEQISEFKQNSNIDLKSLNEGLEDQRVYIASKTQELNELKLNFAKIVNEDATLNPLTSVSKFFLQYLIEQKQNQAYAIADDEELEIKKYGAFFKRVEDLFKNLYEDSSLKLKHKLKENLFYFEFEGGLKAGFNQIADGFKSVLVMVSEILLQQKAFMDSKKLDVEPSGIVLIDEIEAHLHMSLQEKIFPALTKFFPKLQFIIATHSPQVCASNRNTILYDLTTNHLETNYLGGISYDVLSKAHFGLESEYSIEMTNLLNTARELMTKTNLDKDEIDSLVKIKEQIEDVSPELAYELILFLNKKSATQNDKL